MDVILTAKGPRSLRHVAAITHIDGRPHVRLYSGEVVGIVRQVEFSLMATIIPAAPGHYLVALDGSGVVDREPLIGWAVMPTGALPVTADRGIVIDERPILYPDGRVDDSVQGFASLDEYVAATRQPAAAA